MNPDLETEAKKKALDDLMGAMGDDDMKRKPLLTITIAAGGEAEPSGDEMPDEGVEGMDDGDGFAERVRRERGY